MSLTSFVRTPKRIYRLSQIAQVLARHGFGYLVYNLRLHTHLPLLNRIQDTAAKIVDVGDEALAKRIASVCQELGPTFVKLGQVLSTRPDLIPDSLIKELQSLQNDVKPFESSASREIIENDLKAPIDKLFLSFDDAPIACGSIGQVHKATLSNGNEVVVKVKRPGIGPVIMNDMGILSYIAEQAEKIEDFRIYRPSMIVNEFSRKIERELDFISEASSTARFFDIFSSNGKVKVPKVYWDYSTHNILTLERFEYLSFSDAHRFDEMEIDKKRLASDLATSFASQYFENSMFHADPHPGNLMVSESGSLAIIDFGMVGHVSEELRKQLGAAVVALVKHDLDLFVDIFLDLGLTPADCDLHALRLSIFEVIDKYYGMPLKNIDTTKAFSDIMSVAREHDMVLPRDFVLLAKSFVTVAGIAKELDPDFNFVDAVAPLAQNIFNVFRDKLSSENLSKSATSSAWHLTNLLRQAPKEIRHILRKIKGGDLQVVLKHKGLEPLITDLDKSSNRLALSIILAATLIGSSIIMMGQVGPLILDNVSVLGIVGYLLASVMGFSLVVAIFRSGRL